MHVEVSPGADGAGGNPYMHAGAGPDAHSPEGAGGDPYVYVGGGADAHRP